MKIINKSVGLAHSLFPPVYNSRRRYGFFHFSFLYLRNKLISIGQNNMEGTSPTAAYFGKRFNVEQFKKYSFLHSEIDCLSKVWGKQYISSRMRMVVIRLNSKGELGMSKPCSACNTVLNALGVDEVYYSNNNCIYDNKDEIIYDITRPKDKQS